MKRKAVKIAVITGCDSGIGKNLCRIIARKGYRVIISYLEKNPFPGEPGITGIKLDLRKEKEIAGFAEAVKNELSGEMELTFLINNAGVALGGPVENIPLGLYREVFEINFFGLISLTQKLIPEVINSGGRIINIGSMAGRVPLPFLSPYASAKSALRGFTGSLRRELLPHGIKTILIEPTAIATPIWNKALEQDDSFVSDKYSESIEMFRKNFVKEGNKGMDTEKAVKEIYRIINKRNPSSSYILSENIFSSYLQLLIPDKILDRLLIKLFSMYYGEKK